MFEMLQAISRYDNYINAPEKRERPRKQRNHDKNGESLRWRLAFSDYGADAMAHFARAVKLRAEAAEALVGLAGELDKAANGTECLTLKFAEAAKEAEKYNKMIRKFRAKDYPCCTAPEVKSHIERLVLENGSVTSTELTAGLVPLNALLAQAGLEEAAFGKVA
ncbi:MAG: hypothetical protein IJ087_16395 [Eggerthellaceae bacterium]|nr:hypothetical protein [Eggerthellaceae bacterium]